MVHFAIIKVITPEPIRNASPLMNNLLQKLSKYV